MSKVPKAYRGDTLCLLIRLKRPKSWPSKFNAFVDQKLLKLANNGFVCKNFLWREAVGKAEACQEPGGLADVPFDRMQTKAAVGDVGCADVFASGKKVFHPDRNQCPEWNLKR